MSSPTQRLCIHVIVLVFLTPFSGTILSVQDLSSSAGVFISHPSNPPVHRRHRKADIPAIGSELKDEPKKQRATQKAGIAEGGGQEAKKEDSVGVSSNDINDMVEDAL